MRIFLLIVLLQAGVSSAQRADIYKNGWIDFNKNGKKDVFEDPDQPLDNRVENLLSLMTLEEKTCQMATLYGYGRVLKDELPTKDWQNSIWKDGIANIDEALNSLPNNLKAQTKYSYPHSRHASAINTIQKWFVEETRLGIPVDFTNEGIHGLCHDRATPLPAPISIGSTWNKNLVHQAGRLVGREAKALGYTNIYAPILDPARDPRWGRVVECYGEDPFLVAELGTQMALGIQEQGVAATLKHFAVYSIPKGGRDGNARTDPHVAPREMHQIYLYPFRKVIENAHPMGVMSSYNDWDGEPVTASSYFLTKLLRHEYGFKGYVVSDSRAVEYLFEKHKVAADFKEATRQSVEAGLNVWTNFRMPDTYITNIRELVREGKLSMATVDQRVADVLSVKFRLGLFDQPFVTDPALANRIVHTDKDDSLELQLNRESMVLLKNTGNLLPVNPKLYKKILVVGPLAADTGYAVSRYGPSNNPVTSVLEGILAIAGKENVRFEQGCTVVHAGWPESEILPSPLTRNEMDSLQRVVTAAQNSDLIIAILGENEKTVGESLSRTSLDLPGRQQQLLEIIASTGKPVVLVLITGQPLTINYADRFVPAILLAGFPGPSGGRAIAETIFGFNNPGGRLSMTWPKSTGQLEFNFPFKPGSQASQSQTPDPNGYGKTSVNGPIYPFGFGLSYSSFMYSNIEVNPYSGGTQSEFIISAEIQNTGSRDGDEVVQLYIRDLLSSVTTYDSQLRGFERVHLKAGEKKKVQFILKPDDLSLWDKNMKWIVEPGDFEILLGSSSVDIRLKKIFSVH